jgi:hypothetical protein
VQLFRNHLFTILLYTFKDIDLNYHTFA